MPDEPRDPFDDPNEAGWGDDEPLEGASRPAKKGRGWKIALIVLIAIVVLIALCCGGFAIFFGTQFQQTSSAEDIQGLTDQILAIDIPDDYEPSMGSKMPMLVMEATIVSYEGPDEQGLHLVHMTGSMIEAQPSYEALEPQLQSFLAQPGHGRRIQATSLDIREIEVDGQTHDFKLATGTTMQSDGEWTELRGLIPTQEGVVMIAIQAPSDAFDEEAATEIVKSIDVP